MKIVSFEGKFQALSMLGLFARFSPTDKILTKQPTGQKCGIFKKTVFVKKFIDYIVGM